MEAWSVVLIALACLIVGLLAGWFALRFWLMRKKDMAQKNVQQLLSDAKKNADSLMKSAQDQASLEARRAQVEGEVLIAKAHSEAEEYRYKAKEEAERQVASRRTELNALERDFNARQTTLERRESVLSDRENVVAKETQALENSKVDLQNKTQVLAQQTAQVDRELEKAAGLSLSEAKKELMVKVEERSTADIAQFLADRHEEAEAKAEEDARAILGLAIERYSQDVVVEKTVTTVALPNDEMKGRVIGREGRNIKSLESILGVDVLIDDTPGILTVSCFDPVRREIAVKTLQILIKDGRIQPGRIEDIHEKVKASIEEEIKKTGEETVMKLGLPRINRELCKYIGRLKYRTSFGQNVLDHSIQVATLCGMMAAELHIDQTMAKRCGLLHDIGKAADSEIEGSHVEIGVQLAKKYGEPEPVINAIASHHGDAAKKYVTDELVVAADTLSAARPGARSETLENYIKRLQNIEEICKSYAGVKNCYALQSGRDVRVMVVPNMIDDKGCIVLSQQIKDRIQGEMTYPGNIKITVIRETRAIEIAR